MGFRRRHNEELDISGQDSPERGNVLGRHRRGLALALAAGGIATLAVVAETQEDYAPDNYSSMSGMQVESMSVVRDPLTAFARAVHGNWSTSVHPGSVNDVIAKAEQMRPYFIDTKASQALNALQYPDLDAPLPEGVSHIQLAPPQVDTFTKNKVALTYSAMPSDIKARYSDDQGTVIVPIFNAIEAANRQAVQDSSNLQYPSPGWYPQFTPDLAGWTADMPAMTSQQIDTTWQQAAGMLYNSPN